MYGLFSTIRKHDGTKYEPGTLTSIQYSIDRYLKEKIAINIRKDELFKHFNHREVHKLEMDPAENITEMDPTCLQHMETKPKSESLHKKNICLNSCSGRSTTNINYPSRKLESPTNNKRFFNPYFRYHI
ncbi:hypothetical protein MAR_027836 [Mya arenaria]|uniref:Uncharacterized protein n=1 Tax=Mya arenaria TaxID=6604 RepID=A0ABY7EYA8_MYAAR|nr:hypothetical protein MAR_027836 [Mya arenaria]